jgi:hypothetical protein
MTQLHKVVPVRVDWTHSLSDLPNPGCSSDIGPRSLKLLCMLGHRVEAGSSCRCYDYHERARHFGPTYKYALGNGQEISFCKQSGPAMQPQKGYRYGANASNLTFLLICRPRLKRVALYSVSAGSKPWSSRGIKLPSQMCLNVRILTQLHFITRTGRWDA